MALALLELTETAFGDVLEQLRVTTAAEAAAHPHGALGAAVNRIRLFAQIDGALPGVPARIRWQLEHAALDSLTQLARRGPPRSPCAPFRALWHADHLQELNSHSLVDSFAAWLRQDGTEDHAVLIELSDAAPAAVTTMERNLQWLHTRWRDDTADHQEFLCQSALGAPPLPGPAVGTDPAPACTLTSAQQILRDAAVGREALAVRWLTAAEVNSRLGSQAANGSHGASQLRRAGRLLGVYVTHPAPSYRYPTWQFRPDGQPVDHFTELLTMLRNFGPFEREPDSPHRTTGWGEVEWFLSPHLLLDGATPAETLATDPAGVLQAARTEFEGEA